MIWNGEKWIKSDFRSSKMAAHFVKKLKKKLRIDLKSWEMQLKVIFDLSIAFLAISDQYATLIFLSQNGRRWPFWMTENYFLSHFSPFQINTQLLYVHVFYFFHKMAAGGHFGWPKITFDRFSHHFRSIRNFYFCNFVSQNGCRRPFSMTENRFRSHFSPFQINTSSVLIWNGEKCHWKWFSVIQNGLRPFVKKVSNKVVYWSEMARNGIKSDFRSSKMAAHFGKKLKKKVAYWSEMVRNAIESDFGS